jgi:outer membrane protein assembly factor BamB
MREARRQSITLYAVLVILASLVSLTIFATASAQSSGGSGYRLMKKAVLGGDGTWDYLFADASSQRVFISRATHTMVVDGDGNLLGDIPKTDGVHGIAVSTEINRGFTSNGRANTVTLFNLKTLQATGEVKVNGENPDTLIYDPASKRVFTFNGRSEDATAIDASTGEVAGMIKLGGKPETAQADGAGHIYVNIEDKSQIVAFDSKALKVLDTWSIAPCDSPSGMAIDIAHHRLFSGCHNKMMVMVDSTNGKVVATVPIGDGVDADAFDPGTGFAFASCGDGTITVAHEDSPDRLTVADTIMTQRGARTMTVDTKTHNVYTVTADFGPVPAATPDNPRPRASMVPNSFTLLIYSMTGNAAGAAPAAPAPSSAPAAAIAAAPANSATPSGSLVAQGKALYGSYRCYDCHGMNGEGTDIAPDLIGTRLSGDQISAFLQMPSADASAKGMPDVPKTSPDLQPLVAYVLSLKSSK